MSDRLEFWKGVTVGMLAGVAAAALARFASPPPISPDGRGEILKPTLRSRDTPVRIDTLEFRSRRDQPESAGDPAKLAPFRTHDASTQFERQGGSPGGATDPERLETPGRPGQQIDHSDPSAPVRISPRTLDLNTQPDDVGSKPAARRTPDWSS